MLLAAVGTASPTTPMLGWALGMQEMMVLAILGLLIFGKRLPEVGKSLGKSIVEFKKGLNGIEDDVNQTPPAPPRQDILPPPRPTGTESRTDVNEKQATPTGQAS
jgi:sec-independent protein translocase protein TatA